MKLATFRTPNRSAHIGIVHDGDSRLFDLTAAAAKQDGGSTLFRSMLDLIDGGPPALEKASQLFSAHAADPEFTLAIGSVELMAPIPQPRQIRDCMSYETHIRQSGRGMRRLVAADNAQELAAIDAEPLAPLAPVYRQLPIY